MIDPEDDNDEENDVAAVVARQVQDVNDGREARNEQAGRYV